MHHVFKLASHFILNNFSPQSLVEVAFQCGATLKMTQEIGLRFHSTASRRLLSNKCFSALCKDLHRTAVSAVLFVRATQWVCRLSRVSSRVGGDKTLQCLHKR